MYLRASQSFDEMIKATESTLGNLKFEFIRNQSLELVEYEIGAPAYFRIVIEPRKDPEVHNFILPSITRASGSTIDLRFDIDANDADLKIATEHASSFLQNLIGTLEKKPWDSLKMRESGREKKRWKEALKGSGLNK